MRWNPTVHAVRRLKERCGIDETQAKPFINQLMKTAKYVTTQGPDRLIYKAEGLDLLIAVNPEKNTIITVHSATETDDGVPTAIQVQSKSVASITVNRLASAIKREFDRMQREVRREVRQLSEELARLNIEVATLNLNKIRCRAPHTQSLIQSRIDAMMAEAGELAKRIDAKLTEVEMAQSEVEAVVGE